MDFKSKILGSNPGTLDLTLSSWVLTLIKSYSFSILLLRFYNKFYYSWTIYLLLMRILQMGIKMKF